MNLNLDYESTAEIASALAALIVPVALERSQANLDYTPNSIEEIDRMIESFRGDGVQVEEIADTLLLFGYYVGEVFVRHANGHWRAVDETPLKGLSDAPMVIQTSQGSLCNPIDKTLKRFINGEEDNLAFFYSVFASK